jgi:hypothetical protein
MALSDTLWAAAWPEDHRALAHALALAAAFPALVGPLIIRITGAVQEALVSLLADLAAEDISASDLPKVQLLPVADVDDSPSVRLLPAALSASCEYERRPWLPIFAQDDNRHRNVWAAAMRVLATDSQGTATVVAETLEGSESIRDLERVTVVSASPALRRDARRRALGAVPRPPSTRHLPSADFLVADARRPEDLALIGGSDAQTLIVNTDHISPMALEALGVSPEQILGRAGLSLSL